MVKEGEKNLRDYIATLKSKANSLPEDEEELLNRLRTETNGKMTNLEILQALRKGRSNRYLRETYNTVWRRAVGLIHLEKQTIPVPVAEPEQTRAVPVAEVPVAELEHTSAVPVAEPPLAANHMSVVTVGTNRRKKEKSLVGTFASMLRTVQRIYKADHKKLNSLQVIFNKKIPPLRETISNSLQKIDQMRAQAPDQQQQSEQKSGDLQLQLNKVAYEQPKKNLKGAVASIKTFLDKLHREQKVSPIEE